MRRNLVRYLGFIVLENIRVKFKEKENLEKYLSHQRTGKEIVEHELWINTEESSGLL